MKTFLEALPLTLKMNDWFSLPRVAAVLALALLLTVSMGCASSPARDSEDGDQPASRNDQEFNELDELLALVDDFNLSNATVANSKEGITVEITGATALAVGTSNSSYITRVSNWSQRYIPEKPFSAQVTDIKYFASGPISFYSYADDAFLPYFVGSGMTQEFLFGISCDEVGEGVITGQVSGETNETVPRSTFSRSVDFPITCYDDIEATRVAGQTDDEAVEVVENDGIAIPASGLAITSSDTCEDLYWGSILDSLPAIELDSDSNPTGVTTWEGSDDQCGFATVDEADVLTIDAESHVWPGYCDEASSTLPEQYDDLLDECDELEDVGIVIDPSVVPTIEISDDLTTSELDINFDDSPTEITLDNGFTVEVSVSQWNGNPQPSLRRSWAGLVDLLRYTIHVDVFDSSNSGTLESVEFQVFSVDQRGSSSWGEVQTGQSGFGLGPFEGEMVVGWAGQYVVKGSVGEEPFEFGVDVVEPPVRYGALVEPGTWDGRTPLDPSAFDELADVSGKWQGMLPDDWQQQVASSNSVEILKNQSQVDLTPVEMFIEPLETSNTQMTPDGGRIPYNLMQAQVIFEGTLLYHLPALSFDDGHCGDETVTYNLSGSIEYVPSGSVWAGNLVVNGTLAEPRPTLATELPVDVLIRATRSGPIKPGDVLDLLIEFSEFQPNPSTVINDESTCRSEVSSINLSTILKGK